MKVELGEGLNLQGEVPLGEYRSQREAVNFEERRRSLGMRMM